LRAPATLPTMASLVSASGGAGLGVWPRPLWGDPVDGVRCTP
jgi:hypothetical protein